jgi:LEA14-like dessication related protein
MKRMIFLLLALVATGCSAMNTTTPEVAVVDLSFENVTLLETVAVFTVRVDNENPFPLEITGGVHRFYLNDTYIGKGFDDEGFSVPRLSSATHDIRVHISNLSMLTKVQSLVESEKLSYRIDSVLYGGSGSPRRMHADSEGVFDFKSAFPNRQTRSNFQKTGDLMDQ